MHILDIRRSEGEAVPRFIATYGPNHPDTAFSFYVYGVFRNRQHEYADAERLLRQALAIQLGQYSDDHPSIADTREALGVALTERGQFSEAETMLQRACEVIKKTYGAAAPETNEVSAALDKLHDRMKKGRGGS